MGTEAEDCPLPPLPTHTLTASAFPTEVSIYDPVSGQDSKQVKYGLSFIIFAVPKIFRRMCRIYLLNIFTKYLLESHMNFLGLLLDDHIWCYCVREDDQNVSCMN